MKILIALFLCCTAHAEPQLNKLKLPPNTKISVYAKAANARSLTLGPNGIVFVGSRTEGQVYALLPDKKNPERAARVIILAKGLNQPNGVAFKNGDLYVGTISQVLRYRGILKDLDHPPKPENFGPEFPPDEHHGWKFIAFGPDGWLYVPVGAPCNICEPDTAKYAGIFRISPDGKTRESVATGVRNSVGFDWHPENKQLWFSDNGRDMLGDDVPPDEVNRVSHAKENFGYPYCHAGTIADPEFGKKHACSEFTPPLLTVQAHSATLGLRFLRHVKNAPHHQTMLLAEHGSWNRTAKVGYQVVRIEWEGDKVVSSEPWLTGFLQGQEAWGRPVDVLELPDGSVLVSDDTADAVYRIK